MNIFTKQCIFCSPPSPASLLGRAVKVEGIPNPATKDPFDKATPLLKTPFHEGEIHKELFICNFLQNTPVFLVIWGRHRGGNDSDPFKYGLKLKSGVVITSR